MTIVSYPRFFSLFPGLKIKLIDSHFVTVEVIESQAVLNTLTEHYFHGSFIKWQKRCLRCLSAEVEVEVVVASRPKVSF
jgi:hypothetical protein